MASSDEEWRAAYAPVIAILTARRSGLEVDEVALLEGHDSLTVMGVLVDLAERLLAGLPDELVGEGLRCWGIHVASGGAIRPRLRARERQG
jgi:hypothetical protein